MPMDSQRYRVLETSAPIPCPPRRLNNTRRNKWSRPLIHRNFTLVKIGLRRVWGTIKV